MSVDFLPHSKEFHNPLPRPHVFDVVLFFGGYGQKDAGREMPVDEKPHDPDAIPEANLLMEIHKLAPRPGHLHKIQSFYGSFDFAAAAQNGLRFVQDHFHPEGSLILYGLSIGGLHALDVAGRIGSEMPYYDYSTGQFHSGIIAPIRYAAGQAIARVRVDLLITVDAGAGRRHIHGGQLVPPCVRRNLNFFRMPKDTIDRSDHSTDTWGGPNQGDPDETQVDNLDLSGRAKHGQMAALSTTGVLQAIQGVLGSQVS